MLQFPGISSILKNLIKMTKKKQCTIKLINTFLDCIGNLASILPFWTRYLNSCGFYRGLCLIKAIKACDKNYRCAFEEFQVFVA